MITALLEILLPDSSTHAGSKSRTVGVFAHEMEFETANQKEKVSAMENSKRRCWKPKARRGSQKTRSRGEKCRINEGGECKS